MDRFWATTGDARPRAGGRSVGELGEAEPLQPLPIEPYPATVEVQRTVAATCTIAFPGNHYSTPPGLVGQTITVRHRLGTLELTISSAAGGGWPATGSPHRAPAAPCGWLAMPPRWNTSCSRRSPASSPASARPTAHPAPSPSRRPPAAPVRYRRRRVTVDLARYAELAGGDQ